MSAEDLKALEKITDRIGQASGTRPSPGQVASTIVRGYLTSTNSGESGDFAAIEHNVNDKLEAVIAWLPRLTEVITQASDLQKKANVIEAAVKAIKEDMEQTREKGFGPVPF
jgi:hypothetical protein